MNLKKFIVLLFFIWMVVLIGISYGAQTLESLPLKKDLQEGWVIIEGPRLYNKKTLFEHINGQAELFLKYGFQKSIFTIYQEKKNPDSQIELDIYDLGNVLQAFGVFSRFRNEDRPGGFGLDSYLDDHSAFFYKGKYYAMLYAPQSNPTVLKQFATFISSKISDPSSPPKEIGYFPKTGLKSGSIQYFSEGFLGYKFLKRGFQGIYVEKVKVEDEIRDKVEVKAKVEDKEFKLFLALFKNSQEAMNALKAYQDNLSPKAKVSSGSLIEFGTSALKGDDPSQGKVIALRKGFYLLGAVGFENEEAVQILLREFITNIK